ncbi:MAG: hypothetical protein KTR27_18250 [Leptolyngbyaceae cyanobacterium MAG.088]|nr:hypothetical protein [Leptolyngbyaceae cyanobacterium MAG.088]
MTFFPAVIVLVIVFLSFSKEVLGTKEQDVSGSKLKTNGAEPNMSDVLLRYKLMNELQEKP